MSDDHVPPSQRVPAERSEKPSPGVRALLVAAVSILLLIPCFWHRRIEAGDLGSHVYNAWLVTLIEKGQAPGLYVAPQLNNVAVDVLLAFFGKWLGFVAAERIVVALCVLVFFWGSFALITAAAKKPPWFLIPVLAMVAYGYTFEMGFLNFYLSIGLAFLALALVWNGDHRRWIAAIPLALLTYVAHPVGFAVLFGFATFVKLAQWATGWRRWIPLALALLVLTALHFYVARLRIFLWETPRFLLFDGADQVMLFGTRYMILFFVLLAFLIFAIVFGIVRERRTRATKLVRTPLELWAALLFFAAVIPEVIFLPRYPPPLALFVSRATCVSAVLLLCVLGAFRARVWHLAGFAACAASFFVWLHQDTGELNAIEAQAEQLFARLPYGTRILGTLGGHPGPRIMFIGHMLDCACIGHCFTYGDYEPASQQFRIRVRPGARIATDSSNDLAQMEFGQYVVKPEDLPLKQVYQCSVDDIDKLCIRDLQAGVKNCGDCNNPFYAFMHRPRGAH